MRFSLLAALPLIIAGAGGAHAQSLSRAIPPETAIARTVAVPGADAPASRLTVRAAASRPAMLQPLVAVRGLKASAALPPEAAAPYAETASPASRPPSPRAPVQVAASDARPSPAPQSADDSPDDRAAPVRAVRSGRSDLDGDVRCVAQAVFHEARGESVQGQRAVADVVMNRARSGRWGGSACAVVNAPSQFSNRWSWHAPQMGVAAWDRAISIARDAVSGAVGVSSRLMNFRAASMGGGSLRALRIGNHVFW